MQDLIYLGSSPYNENCIQVEKEGEYLPAMRHECQVYASMLRRMFPQLSGKLRVKTHPHDFGSYCEVVLVVQDDEDWLIEDQCPANWDVEARYQLLENESYRECFERQRNPVSH